MSKERLKIFCGTPSYMSPEIVSKKEYYGGPSDIWACGVLLYNLLVGTFPFKSVTTEKDLFRKILRGIFNFGQRESLSSEAKDLIKQMLTIDPSERPTATMILNHPWFKVTGCQKTVQVGVHSGSDSTQVDSNMEDNTTSPAETTTNNNNNNPVNSGFTKISLQPLKTS
jgi:serine/threonine protein kinase